MLSKSLKSGDLLQKLLNFPIAPKASFDRMSVCFRGLSGGMADTQDLKSWVPHGTCGFDSHLRHFLETPMFLQTHTDQASRCQKAIIFLSNRIEGSGNNPKPVIAHSIQVGGKLLELGMPDEIILAGFLHDLIEDSATTAQDIAQEFGEEVARLVQVLTFDETIADREERYQENFQRC